MLYNVPIIVYPHSSNKSDIILAECLFDNDRVVLDNGRIEIMFKTQNNFRVLSIIIYDGMYKGVYSIDSERLVCPLCGEVLISVGLCLNLNCDFSKYI